MRQKIRRILLFVSFLLFPLTIWYFSPYLIIQAASDHIMNGSFIVFASMFVLSMFLGRVWCRGTSGKCFQAERQSGKAGKTQYDQVCDLDHLDVRCSDYFYPR